MTVFISPRRENKYSSRVFPKVKTLRTHTQKHHTKIRKTTKGDFEGNIWTTNQRHFQNVGLDMFLFVLDTFIKVDPFESLTKNDATVCAKLFGPVTDFCDGVKGRF